MTDRTAHARLIKLGADILNQRRWGDSIFAEDAKRQDDALAALGYEAGQIAKLLATPAPAQPEASPEVDEMAAWVRRLVQALRKAAPGNALAEKALDDLKRRGLIGDVLREAGAAAPASSTSSGEAPELIQQAPVLSQAAAPAEGAAWQPIESVPETQELVLLWTRSGKVRVETGWYAKNHFNECKEENSECWFSHWRPPLVGPSPVALDPAAPKEKP